MIQPSSCSSQVSFIQGPDLEVLKIGVWWSEVLTNSPPQKKTGPVEEEVFFQCDIQWSTSEKKTPPTDLFQQIIQNWTGLDSENS